MKSLSRKILNILKDDARTGAEQIAVMLNANIEDVKNEISLMERAGIIVKYSAVINTEKLDDERVEALIEVKVSPQHTKGFDCIAEDVYQFDEVKSVYLMSGAYDLAVFVEGRTLKEVAAFVSEKLSVMDKVLSTATHFILKRYKSDGIILDGHTESKRLVVHP